MAEIRPSFPFVILAAGAACACGALIGTRDLTLVGDDAGADGATTLPDGATTLPDGAVVLPDGATTLPDGAIVASDAGDAATTCTSNVQTDGLNCGVCGHSCLGGACDGGVCQPVPLAQGQAHPWNLAVDSKPDGFVYWGNDSETVDDDAILKVGKDGKNVTQLAHTPQGQVSSPRGVALDNGFVYWVNGRSDALDPGRIAKCAVTGCGSNGTLLISNLDEPQDIVLDGTQMFWIEKSGARIARALESDGGGTATLTGGFFAVGPVDYSVASDNTHVYFAARNTVGRVAKTTTTADAGATYQDIFDGVYTVGVAVDDTNVYWATEDDPGLVQYAPKTGIPSGGVATTLAGQLPNPHAMALDAKNVYWINFGPGTDTYVDGSVMMCPKTGCAASGPITLASKQQNPKDIAVDDYAVYWTVNGNNATDGAVMKIAK